MANDTTCAGCGIPLGPYRYGCPGCSLKVLCRACREAGRRCPSCPSPACRARALCDALALRVSTAPDWPSRLAAARLHQQATALWHRLQARENPPPPPPAASAARRPHIFALTDGIYLNRRHGGWDAWRNGQRIAASRPRLDAEREYDQAAA